MKTEHNDSEKDKLWDLLGKLDAPQPSAFFSRNVLREVRKGGISPAKHGVWRLVLRPLAGVAVACGVFVVGFLVTNQMSGVDSDSLTAALTATASMVDEQDFEIIAHLDDLLAYEENTLWLAELSN